MKIVYNTWFPFGNYHTLNFFGILFTKRKQLPESTITHESIHTAQMKEMLWVFFYLWYGVEYLLIRLFHKKQNCAYHDISLCERLNIMNSGEKNTEQISGEVQWTGSRTFTTNKCTLIISSGKNESIDITLNGQTLVKGTFTSQQEVRFSTITISPGDTLRVSGTVRYS